MPTKRETGNAPASGVATPRREIQLVALPRHMKLSENEMGLVSRLVRVVRFESYWLGAFIEWLLIEDSRCEFDQVLQVKEALAMLNDISDLRTWVDWFSQHPDTKPVLRYFGHKFFPSDVDRMADERFTPDRSKEVVDLVNLWRMDHPEPPKRRQTPKGKTQHESDPDSD